MKIGDSIWYFDENYRVYPPKEPGRLYSGSGPIWREHWREIKVVGETSKSWIVGYDKAKISKKDVEAGTVNHHKWALSQAQIDDLEWVQRHRYKISRHLDGIYDPGTLRQVAALIGYEAER